MTMTENKNDNSTMESEQCPKCGGKLSGDGPEFMREKTNDRENRLTTQVWQPKECIECGERVAFLLHEAVE